MFTLPRRLKIGPGLINSINTTFELNNINGKILLCSDDFVYKKYGIIVREQAKMHGEVLLFLIKENSIQQAIELSEQIISNDIEYVIGVGGGRVLDTCKYASHMTKRKFVSIPTIVSNDGVASPIAVLKHKSGRPKSLGSTMPYVIIIDTDIIIQSPIQYIHAGIGDTISNYTALFDWDYAEQNGKETKNDLAYLISQTAFDIMINSKLDRIDQNFIEILVQSLVLSGIAMEMAGTSRPCSGAEHLFSHAIDYYFTKNNLHGLQVALGTIIMAKLYDIEYKFLIDFLKKYNIKVSPLSLGITREEFKFCMEKAPEMRPDRYTFLNEVLFNKTYNFDILFDDLMSELE
ncbi:MAG: iron-containing alcohol dehydrogenase family protein [Bacteroidales bacterium]|nr:iron-containing alcohol dehydrogenase family protein [Bacteroidales bacterium]